MRYGSVCSGIEAVSLAWEPIGFTPVFFSEIDPFCNAVLARHWPAVPNLGDITRDDWCERAARLGPIDVLVGGTPCTGFSTAGKREGLRDSRSALALTFLKIAEEIRPEWLVWENVAGCLTTAYGRDFGAFLGRVADLGYRWAYRVLDAKHHGVPQRRRRVFLVASLGAGCPSAVLLEPQGEGRDLAAGGEAGADAAGHAPAGAGGVVCVHSDALHRSSDAVTPSPDAEGRVRLRPPGLGVIADGTAYTLNATGPHAVAHPIPFDVSEKRDSPTVGDKGEIAVVYQCHGNNVGPMGTLRAGNGGLTGGVPFIVNATYSCEKQSHARPTDTARCLDSSGGFASQQGGTVVVNLMGANRRKDRPEGGLYVEDGADTSKCVDQTGLNPNCGQGGTLVVEPTLVVRRLTPRECERLQGIPDDHTLVTYRGRSAADGPRYRAIGNSMAVPVVRQIGERLIREHRRSHGQ